MAYGRLTEASAGKDSTTGHWEIAGLITTEPQATFTETGFPDELVEPIEQESGFEFIGNYAASGTVILDELGQEHLETGKPILYTSADSVFQIAAHNDVIALGRPLPALSRSPASTAIGIRSAGSSPVLSPASPGAFGAPTTGATLPSSPVAAPSSTMPRKRDYPFTGSARSKTSSRDRV